MSTESRHTEGRRPHVDGLLLSRLMQDESGVTTLEYVVAAIALAIAAVAASRAIAGVLKNYLHRIYLVVTLPIP